MKKNILITVILGVVLLILIIIAAVFLLTKNTAKSASVMAPTKAPNAVTQIPAKRSNIQGTLHDLLAQGKPVKCTYSSNTGTGSYSGIVYVVNNKMRADFKSTSDTSSVSGHMILDAGYSYVWTDLSKRGMKINISGVPTPAAAANSQSQTPDLNQKIDYSCTDWTADTASFILPGDITFTTFAIPSIPAANVSGAAQSNTNQSACSTCDRLPANAQQICRTQPHCQ